jgi:predicted acyltransferase
MSDSSSESVPTSPVSQPSPPAPSRRLTSLDALRGFDMFWIVGGEEIFHALYQGWPNRCWQFFDRQMNHSDWEGFRFYDLIFPLFVFIVGTSMVFSLTRLIQQNGKAAALKRILVRSLLMYAFGLLVYGGISKGIDQVRWLGVLQRIALCYLVAGSLFCVFRPRALAAICVSLLLGYWAVTSLVPIRDFNLEKGHLRTLNLVPESPETRARFFATTIKVTGKFENGLCLPQHLDFLYLPGFRWDGAYDPEGLLSTFPAIATCLLGVFAGLLLRSPGVPGQKAVVCLVGAGAASVALGWLWGTTFPVIKTIWSSSYVLVAGGYSCLLLGTFYQVIEIWQWRKWSVPFVWIGMNPITIYMAFHLLDFNRFAALVVGGPVRQGLGPFGHLVMAGVTLVMMFAIVRFLHQRKIFLRL